jgi:hypothetical protein
MMATFLFATVTIWLQFSMTTATTCSPGQLSDTIHSSDVLSAGQAIVSSDGSTMLWLGTNGSLKIKTKQADIWSQEFPNPNGRYLTLQDDGNLVLYDVCANTRCPVWATYTIGVGTKPHQLVMQTNGDLVLSDSKGVVTWHSDTANSTSIGATGACVPCTAGTYSSKIGDLCSSCSMGSFSGKGKRQLAILN